MHIARNDVVTKHENEQNQFKQFMKAQRLMEKAIIKR